jgi:hypothetical protein
VIEQALQYFQALVQRGEKHDKTISIDRPYNGQNTTYLHTIEPTQYGPKVGAAFQPYRAAKLEVSTLTGFVDAIKAGAGGTPDASILHVEDYLTVALKAKQCDVFGVRDTLLQAKYQPNNAFQLEIWYTDPQKFIIAFQAGFHMIDPDGPYVLKLASNLTASSSVHASDDGINQVVTIKTGEIKTAEHSLKPRVKLVPRTTFDEANPVEREFLIRLRQTPDQTPAIALFALDGTKWQGENMRAIKEYLASQLPEWTILA